MDTEKILLGVLGGVVAGTLLGVLLARDKSEGSGENANEYDLADQLNAFHADITKKVEALRDKNLTNVKRGG